jgi:hypothetical protein
MSSRDPSGNVSQQSHVREIVPIDAARLESLSWELGNRVTSDEHATRRLTLRQPTAGWACTVFDVTDHTCVLRFRTPVGREKFFGVALADLLPELRDRAGGGWEIELFDD